MKQRQDPSTAQRDVFNPQCSDEQLCGEISARLRQVDEVDCTAVTVQVLGGKVILEGTVPDRQMKHAIEGLAEAAPGVQDVENRIRVTRA
jgi:osmotically-inducible protein OsmY